ncbi:MAG: SIMPL domain-containing protein [Anaerolineae bacterium]|nr:SIMPL domain-containing protein [Anaerolineae bacterium]
MQQKTLTLVLLAIIASLVLGGWAMAEKPQASTEPGVINVSGEAEMRVVPDEVIIRLGVETSDQTLLTAKKQNEQIVKRVIALAKQYGIPTELVQTDYIQVEPRYNSSYEQRSFIGYFVHNTIVITLRDISKFESFLTDVLGTGVNYVHSIDFRTTKLREYRDRARTLALEAAQEKALAMSGTLGQQLGEPRNIQEEANNWWSGYGSWWSGSWGGAMSQNVIQEVGGNSAEFDSSLAPGQISIKARVSVSFSMSPKP